MGVRGVRDNGENGDNGITRRNGDTEKTPLRCPVSPRNPVVSVSTVASPENTAAHLDRGLGLLQATSANILVMIGVGPFLTIPFMLTAMGGPHILYAWIAGAVLALCDGLVYAQLGAALPGSGGPYVYLREAYKPFGLGSLMGFLFIFQTMLVAPLTIASGGVGFADYLGVFWTMPGVVHDLIAALVAVAMTALLYRHIRDVGRLSVIMLVIVGITVGWVIVGGLLHFSIAQAFSYPRSAFVLDRALVSRVGAVSLLAMYNYGGYNNVCNIAEEIRDPRRNVPRAIVLSIVVVVALYVAMSTVIVGVVPWTEAQHSRAIASLLVERTFADPARGHAAARLMTVLILFVTVTSLYGLILGYSRIPFAAAREGQFFRAFARVHPTKHFPHVSLVTIGASAVPFCFLSLGQIVNWLVLVEIVSQFIWQCAGVILLRRYRTDIPQPFVMWLYPMPVLVALALWIYVFVSAPVSGMLFAGGVVAVGVAAYFVFDRRM
jgi:amino acid transporter